MATGAHGRSLWFAVPITLGATAIAVPVAVALDEWVREMAVCAVPSAFVSGAWAGRRLTAGTELPPLGSALKAGIAVALLSHLGMTALFALYHLMRGEFVPFGNFVTVPFFGALSILVAGWLTVPVGAACGALAWYVRRRRLRPAQAPSP